MSSAAKVGVFMLLILAILGYLVLRIEDIDIGRGGNARTITAIFDNVAGLDEKSAVRIAGVRKGKVTNIEVQPDGRAKVTMEVDDDVPIRGNATARVANLGLLGEKFVEIDPGTPAAPVITSGEIVLPGSQPASIDDVTSQVAAIADDVKAITASFRGALGGRDGEERVDDIVSNVHEITTQIRELIAANRTNVDATLANAREITAALRVEIPRLANRLDSVASSLGGAVSENREDIRVIVDNLRGLSRDLRTTADNLNAITGQVKSGEGTVGKLLYSDEAHKRLTSALESVEGGVTELKNTLGRVGRIEMDLGIKADYHAGLNTNDDIEGIQSTSRSAVQLRLRPNPEHNRFYNIELADDPAGRRRVKVIQETVTDPATGQSRTLITREERFERDFVISGQVGWALGPYDLRVGLFDNAGGAGVDYRLNDRIRVTGEIFDFGKKRDDSPHVRLFSEYVLRREKPRTPMLFVTGGVDNALNDTAFTFGGGIRWRDDDLKYLLGSIPVGK